MKKEKELSRLLMKIEVKREALEELYKQWDEAVNKEIANKSKGLQSQKDSEEQSRLANTVAVAKRELRQLEQEYNNGKGLASDDEVEALANSIASGWQQRSEDDDLADAIAALY